MDSYITNYEQYTDMVQEVGLTDTNSGKSYHNEGPSQLDVSRPFGSCVKRHAIILTCKSMFI